MSLSDQPVAFEVISRVAVKLPPLWKGNAAVWFIQVEANFSVAQITNDDTKYNYVLAAIESDTLGAVSDLIVTPLVDNKYQALKERFIMEFSYSQSQQIRKLLSELTFETIGPPLFPKPLRVHPKVSNEVKKEFQYLIDQRICSPSKSPWASPIHVVPKADGSYRVCGDNRRLNSVTVPDRYPITHIYNVTNILHDKKIFSKLDLVRAYFHIPDLKDHISKASVTTPFGSFEFLYLNFGLKCAANIFQRFINEVLSNWDFAIAYLDDILFFSENEIQHLEHMKIVLGRLAKYGLNVNIWKSVFAQTELSFLGHDISPAGIKPLKSKVEVIQNYPRP
ncbi:Transposon Ty3-I Gag-Pol polyprotein [Araneus ventricosus]|uniref:Transposon Ty3-I Gag-Pol polyprotein n=1 Tax=Araneus ventricosus TaxID=182803 RepID=A0A4Y2GWE2_ARAVE|nr:Transposon Ty3-I Gag-Pol polyprotein [Araneus ventricosus]